MYSNDRHADDLHEPWQHEVCISMVSIGLRTRQETHPNRFRTETRVGYSSVTGAKHKRKRDDSRTVLPWSSHPAVHHIDIGSVLFAKQTGTTGRECPLLHLEVQNPSPRIDLCLLIFELSRSPETTPSSPYCPLYLAGCLRVFEFCTHHKWKLIPVKASIRDSSYSTWTHLM